jgi:hypothetical protein
VAQGRQLQALAEAFSEPIVQADVHGRMGLVLLQCCRADEVARLVLWN